MRWESFFNQAGQAKNTLIDGVFLAYKCLISPIFYFFGARCRFEPTCSEYGREALKRHGILVGLCLAVSRLLKCHPFGSSGLDTVPKELKLKKFFPGLHKFGRSQR